MADEPHTTIRAIDWRAIFPFLNLFKAFRVAIHPSKLVLGLAALLLVYAGGRVMDAVWPTSHLALPGELKNYEQYAEIKNPPYSFKDGIEEHRRRLQDNYAGYLIKSNAYPDLKEDVARKKAEEASKSFGDQRRLKGAIINARDLRMAAAAKALETETKKAKDDYDARVKAIDANAALDANAKADEKKKAEKDRDQALREAELEYPAALRRELSAGHAELRNLESKVPHGVFDTFFKYETRQINAVVSSVLAGNWTRAGAAEAVAARPPARDARGERDTALDEDLGTVGVFPAVLNFFTVGPAWLLRYHLVYAVIFIAWFLLIWAVFGGAISRIAAVHVARDEKISVRQALKFSISKVLSFVFAPVIPLLIVLVIGVLLAVAGLLFYIPHIGPIVVGALFILGIIAAVIVTLVLFGTAGGLSLMYPTVAVEGSDSFDAISRSFSYVFARPWKMLFYTIVAVAYGALCYLFVKFFIYVTLLVTHFFVGWWLRGNAGLWYPEFWPAPTFASLPYDIDFAGLKFTDQIAAFLISFWVYLLVGLLGAFAISFYFSASTIIYYLMRREVDATELDDVYIEESEDDLADTAPITGATIGAPAVVAATPTTTIVTPSTPAASSDPSVPTGSPDLNAPPNPNDPNNPPPT